MDTYLEQIYDGKVTILDYEGRKFMPLDELALYMRLIGKNSPTIDPIMIADFISTFLAKSELK